MKGWIGLVLLALTVLSASVGQENVAGFWNGENTDQHALPILINDSDLGRVCHLLNWHSES